MAWHSFITSKSQRKKRHGNIDENLKSLREDEDESE